MGRSFRFAAFEFFYEYLSETEYTASDRILGYTEHLASLAVAVFFHIYKDKQPAVLRLKLRQRFVHGIGLGILGAHLAFRDFGGRLFLGGAHLIDIQITRDPEQPIDKGAGFGQFRKIVEGFKISFLAKILGTHGIAAQYQTKSIEPVLRGLDEPAPRGLVPRLRGGHKIRIQCVFFFQNASHKAPAKI